MQNQFKKLHLSQETIRNLTSGPHYFETTLGCPGSNNCTPTKTQDLPND